MPAFLSRQRGAQPSLRILHVLRAPEGGLFRHVLDLADEQARRGHCVGLVADSLTGGAAAEAALGRIAPALALGVHRFAMRRRPDPRDMFALVRLYRLCATLRPDVLHGHGAKGGFYARLIGSAPGAGGPLRVYTAHGGAFHPQPGHDMFMRVERALAHCTDLLLFESDFLARRYGQAIGPTRALRCVAKNGLRRDEFRPVALAPGAADFVAIGALRVEKGVDLALRALALLPEERRLAVVGAGPEFCALKALALQLGVERRVDFFPPMPAREAFARGRVVVAPSRAESLPYLALEAIAADKTLIASDVGGLAEIFGAAREKLVASGDVAALARAMARASAETCENTARQRAALIRHVRVHFDLSTMANRVLGAYREALARKRPVEGWTPELAR